MPERTAAEAAAIDHLITKLGKDIADAIRAAEQQEAAAGATAKYSRRLGHEESAKFHRALAALLGDVAEAVKAKFSGPTKYPGVPGFCWRDNEDDIWVLCADGAMRLLYTNPMPREPWELDREYKPIKSLNAGDDDTHSCGNCGGDDPDTCLYNGITEGS